MSECSSVDLDPYAGVFSLSASASDIVMGRFIKHDGSLLCGFNLGINYDDEGRAVMTTNDGGSVAGGTFEGMVDFDYFPNVITRTASNRDLFLARFNRCSNAFQTMVVNDDPDVKSRPVFTINSMGQVVRSNYDGFLMDIDSNGKRTIRSPR